MLIAFIAEATGTLTTAILLSGLIYHCTRESAPAPSEKPAPSALARVSLHLHPFTLAFSEVSLERNYVRARFDNSLPWVRAFCALQSGLMITLYPIWPACWPAAWRVWVCLAAELAARELTGRIADKTRAINVFNWAWSTCLAPTWLSLGIQQNRHGMITPPMDGLFWGLVSAMWARVLSKGRLGAQWMWV